MKSLSAKSQRGLLRGIAKRARTEGRIKDRQPATPPPEKADK